MIQKDVFLNGKKSLNNNQWMLSYFDQTHVSNLSQIYGLSNFLTEIVLKREIRPHEFERFITPTMKSLMPDPSHLKDMDCAVHRVFQALKDNEKIAVFADYDVDGGTSSALLKRYFQELGSDILIYIPDRIEEGYGPNNNALSYLRNQGVKVVIMVDCGTTAFAPLEHAQSIGLDVIIIDHHLSEESFPAATALINPNRCDEDSELTHLCSVGLCFMFVIALTRYMRQQGAFQEGVEPDLKSLMDLVALGTVCDVMPLTGLNRAFVQQGLRVMKAKKNIGLVALMEVVGIQDAEFSGYHLGFVLGPRINAGGRVGKADLGATLLSTHDIDQARQIANELNELNKARQEIEQDVLAEAVAQIEKYKLFNNPFILVKGEGWHPGVIGIVASRLKEQYGKPAAVVTFEDNIGKGSGRSISGVNLGHAMHQAREKGFLINGGGHAMAVGFTVNANHYDRFYAYLNKTLGPIIEQCPQILHVDGALNINSISEAFVDSLKVLEPFGNANPTPRFLFTHLTLGFAKVVGQNHVQCVFVSEQGTRIKGMAFRMAEHPIGEFLLNSPNQAFHVVGTIKKDEWNGSVNLTLNVEDVMI